MTGKSRTLTLLVATVGILGVLHVADSPAEHFSAEVAHATLVGAQSGHLKTHIEGVEGGIECNKIELDGTTISATVTELKLQPTYEGCTAFGNAATVVTTGCYFTFTIDASIPGATGKVHLECEPGRQFEFKFTLLGSACIMTKHTQTPTEPMVTFETGGNAGTMHDLLLTWQVKGITYTRDGGGFCVFLPNEGNNMTMSGAATIRAFDTAGSQVGLTAT